MPLRLAEIRLHGNVYPEPNVKQFLVPNTDLANLFHLLTAPFHPKDQLCEYLEGGHIEDTGARAQCTPARAVRHGPSILHAHRFDYLIRRW